MSSNQELKQRILDAIHQAQNQGYTLVCEGWGDSANKCACALSCLSVAEGKDIIGDPDYYAPVLGVSYDWIYSFLAGFDDDSLEDSAGFQPEAFYLGNEIRKETHPIIYDAFTFPLGNDNEI